MKAFLQLSLTTAITIGCLYFFVRENASTKQQQLKQAKHPFALPHFSTCVKAILKTLVTENAGDSPIRATQIWNICTDECKETILRPRRVALVILH